VSGLGQDVASSRIAKATRAILQRHDGYSKDLLCEFLAQRFPEIPACARKILVVGASTAAAFAAHHYDVVRESWLSADPQKKKCGADAGCVLSYWSMGLGESRSDGKSDVVRPPRVMKSLAPSATATTRDVTSPSQPVSVPVSKVRDVMLNKVFPVPMAAGRPHPQDPVLRDDLMTRALVAAGLSDVVAYYGVGGTQCAAEATYAHDDADVHQDQQSQMEHWVSGTLSQEGGLLSIGTAVLAHRFGERGCFNPSQAEQYDPTSILVDHGKFLACLICQHRFSPSTLLLLLLLQSCLLRLLLLML